MSKTKQNLLNGTAPVVQKAFEPQSYNVDGFCAAHSISKSALHLMWQEGTGPDVFYVGQRRMVSKEAAARWRQEREAAAVAAE
jgi:hypothetical protein